MPRDETPRFNDETEETQSPCIVCVTIRWKGEAGSNLDAVHMARRLGDVEDWDITWTDAERP